MQFRIQGLELFLALGHEGDSEREIFVTGAQSSRTTAGVRFRDVSSHDLHHLNFKLFNIVAYNLEGEVARELQQW